MTFKTRSNDDFSFMLGYWIENSAPGEYPWVGLKIEVHPKSPIRPILINAMRHFISAKNEVWEQEDLSHDKAWSAIARGKRLNELLVGEDHLASIQLFFGELIAEIREFRASNPDLPWSKSAAGG